GAAELAARGDADSTGRADAGARAVPGRSGRPRARALAETLDGAAVMEGSVGRLTAIALVILIPAGFLLTRLLGRRMGDFRRDHLAEINRVLSDLAATAGGAFDDGPLLTNHPLLGELHRYGT